MPTIIVDTFEPPNIVDGLKKHLDVVQTSLVNTGMCDYAWYCIDGHSVTVERKAVSDFVNNLDRLENQLKNALTVTDEVLLLIEGVFEPVDNGSCMLYHQPIGKSMFMSNRIVNRPYSYFMGYLWRLDKLGISHFYTPNHRGTIEALAEFCKLGQNPDTKLFKRYIKTKPVIVQQNSQVQLLINMGVGEVKSKLLVGVFGSVWEILHTKPEELCKVQGISTGTVTKLFEAVGKK